MTCLLFCCAQNLFTGISFLVRWLETYNPLICGPNFPFQSFTSHGVRGEHCHVHSWLRRILFHGLMQPSGFLSLHVVIGTIPTNNNNNRTSIWNETYITHPLQLCYWILFPIQNSLTVPHNHTNGILPTIWIPDVVLLFAVLPLCSETHHRLHAYANPWPTPVHLAITFALFVWTPRFFLHGHFHTLEYECPSTGENSDNGALSWAWFETLGPSGTPFHTLNLSPITSDYLYCFFLLVKAQYVHSFTLWRPRKWWEHSIETHPTREHQQLPHLFLGPNRRQNTPTNAPKTPQQRPFVSTYNTQL